MADSVSWKSLHYIEMYCSSFLKAIHDELGERLKPRTQGTTIDVTHPPRGRSTCDANNRYCLIHPRKENVADAYSARSGGVDVLGDRY